MAVTVDRRCDGCGHAAGAHPYDLDHDRGCRGRCTAVGCGCRGYRFDYTAALERRIKELEQMGDRKEPRPAPHEFHSNDDGQCCDKERGHPVHQRRPRLRPHHRRSATTAT